MKHGKKRKYLFIALLDPEGTFEDVVDLIPTEFGTASIEGHKLKLVFEPGDKGAGEIDMFKAGSLVVKAFLSTLAWITDIGVGYRPFDFTGFVDDQLRSMPLHVGQQPQRKVNRDALWSARLLLPLVMSDSTLRWALEDYRTALREPGHELIFLHRCIEWLENRFGGEKELRRGLCITKRQLGKITKPANTYYHARHAQEGGPRPVAQEVLDDAFTNTKAILQKYVDWLRSQNVNAI